MKLHTEVASSIKIGALAFITRSIQELCTANRGVNEEKEKPKRVNWVEHNRLYILHQKQQQHRQIRLPNHININGSISISLIVARYCRRAVAKMTLQLAVWPQEMWGSVDINVLSCLESRNKMHNWSINTQDITLHIKYAIFNAINTRYRRRICRPVNVEGYPEWESA